MSNMPNMPKAVRFSLLALGIALAVVVLFTTVFPWVEERQQDPTLGLADPTPELTAADVGG